MVYYTLRVGLIQGRGIRANMRPRIIVPILLGVIAVLAASCWHCAVAYQIKAGRQRFSSGRRRYSEGVLLVIVAGLIIWLALVAIRAGAENGPGANRFFSHRRHRLVAECRRREIGKLKPFCATG